jgi:midasin
MKNDVFDVMEKPQWSQLIMQYSKWFAIRALQKKSTADIRQFGVTLREMLAWVDFMNAKPESITLAEAFVHGGSMVLLDGLGMVLTHVADVNKIKRDCFAELQHIAQVEQTDTHFDSDQVIVSDRLFGIDPFTVPRKLDTYIKPEADFTLSAPTTRQNMMRVLRAMQLPSNKPILLEGSPGKFIPGTYSF